MPEDNSQEKETSREQGAKEQPAEKGPDFEIREQRTEDREERMEKPEISETEKPSFAKATEGKPEMPQAEGIPKGGPGDQQIAQSQPAAQSAADKGKTAQIKNQLKKRIPEGPQERKTSGKFEDWHNDKILKQS